MVRKAIPTFRRAAIWRAHERRCVYCTQLITFADLDIDHIVPNHLKEEPDQLRVLLEEYGLGVDFDLDDLPNLVPSHRHCNLQKKKQVLQKSRMLHFLSIAQDKHDKARKIESEIREQVLKDDLKVRLEIALDEKRISLEELSILMARYAEAQNILEILDSFPFANSEVKGFLSSIDISSLYERPILPRLNGLNKLAMIKWGPCGEEKLEVCTCREWAESVLDGYHALSTYDIKEETFFKRVYALVVASARAKAPRFSYISDQKASVANFNLLPITILPVLSRDDVEELQRFHADGIQMSDLIALGRVKVVSSSPLSITFHYDCMGLHLHEILRADLNDDGIEDLLVGSNQWALEGSFGAGCVVALTRLGADQSFTIAKNVGLNVLENDV